MSASDLALSSSEGPQDIPHDIPPANGHGRTAWDVLHSMRFIFLIVVAVATVITAVVLGYVSAEALVDTLADTVPYAILSFIGGAYLANRVLNYRTAPATVTF